MDYLPLHFNLQGRTCLLVGGGAVALRRATLLLRAGARLRVVAPALDEGLARIIAENDSGYRQGGYDPSDLDGIHLAIAATDNHEINRRVSEDAQRLRIPVNVVDQRELCTVIFPAIIDRSPLIVSVSSSANSPVLSRKLREKLESMIPAGYGRLAAFIGRYREPVTGLIRSADQRRKFWEWVIDGAVGELVLADREAAAAELLLESAADRSGRDFPGEVALVGAGPGDPDLLTFKALRLMQQADVVLYDSLVSTDILDLCRRDARREYVGKVGGDGSTDQDDLNERMVRLARQGQRVLRLKGGDPFIFARGGEELEELSKAGIQVQVVPGITAASGCASYAGIPLTHRDYAQSVRFVSGRQRGGGIDLDWDRLIPDNQTVVFYMAQSVLPEICRQMIAHGSRPETPVALISRGTLPDQKVYTATLSTITTTLYGIEVPSPALIIVGDVVKVRLAREAGAAAGIHRQG